MMALNMLRKMRRRWHRWRKSRNAATIHPSTEVYPNARFVNPSGVAGRITVGARSLIAGELLLFGHGGRIQIGDDSFVGYGSRIWSGSDVTIGNRVLISHSVTVMDNLTHPIEPGARHEHFRAIASTGFPQDIDLRDRPISIEDDAWIGCQCVILRGVTIGRGAVVGAGSVVRQDVPAFTIVSGNPAAVVRELTAEERAADRYRRLPSV